MRIGINGRYLGPNKTGVGRYLSNLLDIWSKGNLPHEFFIYCSNEQPQIEDNFVFNKSSRMVLRRIPRPFKTNSFLLWYNFSFPRAVIKDKVDFLFSPDYFLPPFLGNIHSSMTIHDVSYLAHPEWFSLPYRIYCQIYSKIPAHNADIIFTVSKFSKQEILKHISIDADRVRVIPIAVHPKFKPGPLSSMNLSQFGINGKYFLYVGKLFNRRHIAEMLSSFDRYLEKSKDNSTQFVLRGKNETYPFVNINKIVNNINTKHCRKAIIVIDYLDDQALISLYQNTSGFFYLSDYEGFGLPILESLACGAPTVTVNTSSIPEVAGAAAIYVNPVDIDEISNIMVRLLSDGEWSRNLRRRSIKQAESFSWNTAATNTLQAIEKCYE